MTHRVGSLWWGAERALVFIKAVLFLLGGQYIYSFILYEVFHLFEYIVLIWNCIVPCPPIVSFFSFSEYDSEMSISLMNGHII
jgi:hypothetical protein